MEYPPLVFKMKQSPTRYGPKGRSNRIDEITGPIVMMFDEEEGWTTEKLGPRNGYKKRLARKTQAKEQSEKVGPTKIKRESPIPLQELDANTLEP